MSNDHILTADDGQKKNWQLATLPLFAEFFDPAKLQVSATLWSANAKCATKLGCQTLQRFQEVQNILKQCVVEALGK